MTHSVDSFITDSANSATALYTGKKSTVNALNVYVDSVRTLAVITPLRKDAYTRTIYSVQELLR